MDEECQVETEKDNNLFGVLDIRNLPRQLPALEQSPQQFDLMMKLADGMGTPKFNDEPAFNENAYLKKR